MIIGKKVFRDCVGFRDIRWVINWSAVFIEAVFESSFGFTYVLFGAVVALYNVNDVFRVTVNVISVAYRRSSNLSDFLVRAQLPNLTEHNQPRGSYPCGKNCLTCKYISEGQTSYTFHVTGETRPITNHTDCNGA